MEYLGIDLGGINIAAAIVSENGQILARSSSPTPRGEEVVADAIAQTVRRMLEQAGRQAEDFTCLGIGAPGTIDPENGVVEYWSNLNFCHVPLAEMLTKRLGLPVLLENDANCAALGEYVAGAGKGSRSMVAITLGTGVGGGAVLDGRLYTGFNHAGLEVGHFVLEYGGRPCTCGRAGCFETYCSATAIIKRARQMMEEHPDSLLWTLSGGLEQVTGQLVFTAMEQGDESARQVVGELTSYLGNGVASLVNIFQPEVFCIGGGLSNAGETLLAPVRAILEREDYARHNPSRTRLVKAQLGNDAGIIGAALLPEFSGKH